MEAGYRSVLFNEKISIDVDFYYNIYRNLTAQVEANIPKAANADSVAWYLNDRQNRTGTGFGPTPKLLVIIMAAL